MSFHHKLKSIYNQLPEKLYKRNSIKVKYSGIEIDFSLKKKI